MSHVLLRSVGKAGDTMWRRIPAPVREGTPGRLVGNCIHAISRRFSSRGQSESTWFLRNEPLLSTILDVLNNALLPGQAVRVCSMACSSGAELYSLLWILRKARPDLDVIPVGVDISKSVLEKARQGCYARDDMEFRGLPDESTPGDLFDMEDSRLRVSNWVRKGAQWIQGDARNPRIADLIGPQDVVLANNFLIHMEPSEASASLVNMVQLVKPGGILVCRGVDLNVRQRVVSRLHLEPIGIRIEQIHDAEFDLDARRHWPWRYYGLEPFNRYRKDCIERYAAIFRTPGAHGRGSFSGGQ